MSREIALIAAVSENGVIGKGGGIPWKIKGDLPRFKQLTTGKPVIMGRKTFESFGARPLMGRLNIVLTQRKHYIPVTTASLLVAYTLDRVRSHATSTGMIWAVNSLDDVLEHFLHDTPAVQGISYDTVWGMGGQSIYELLLSRAHRLEITRVHQKVEGGDAFFPEIRTEEWLEGSRTPAPEGTHDYVTYVRKPRGAE